MNLQGHFKPLLAEDSQRTHTLYQKFETKIHRNETAHLVPNFYIPVSGSVYISTIGLIGNISNSQR